MVLKNKSSWSNTWIFLQKPAILENALETHLFWKNEDNRLSQWPREVKWNFRCRPSSGPRNDKTRARKTYHVACLVHLANRICIQNETEELENIVVRHVMSFIHEIWKKKANKMFAYVYESFIGSDSSNELR